jgi:hypothetical protein
MRTRHPLITYPTPSIKGPPPPPPRQRPPLRHHHQRPPSTSKPQPQSQRRIHLSGTCTHKTRPPPHPAVSRVSPRVMVHACFALGPSGSLHRSLQFNPRFRAAACEPLCEGLATLVNLQSLLYVEGGGRTREWSFMCAVWGGGVGLWGYAQAVHVASRGSLMCVGD